MFCRCHSHIATPLWRTVKRKSGPILNFARFDSLVCFVARSRSPRFSLAAARSRLQVYSIWRFDKLLLVGNTFPTNFCSKRVGEFVSDTTEVSHSCFSPTSADLVLRPRLDMQLVGIVAHATSCRCNKLHVYATCCTNMQQVACCVDKKSRLSTCCTKLNMFNFFCKLLHVASTCCMSGRTVDKLPTVH